MTYKKQQFASNNHSSKKMFNPFSVFAMEKRARVICVDI